jgi:hypothetical protein
MLIALSQTATAGVSLFGQVSCTAVRFYVAKYSETAAEKWARGHGYSEAEIETARRCLHSGNVQSASAVTSSQVPTHVTEQAPAQQAPTEREPHKETPRAPAVQVQRADAVQVGQENQPGVNGVIRPKNAEDRAAGDVRHENKVLSPSDRTSARPRYAAVMHRAGLGHVSWLKRLWNQLTRRRQFSVAALHFGR